MRLRRRAAILAAEALGAILVLLTMVVWPPVQHPTHADAVVILSGDGARLEPALALMGRRVAPTLVFVGLPDTTQLSDICRSRQPFEVVCLHPKPDNTRTEARTTSSLAERRGWNRMVVVTSRYHVTRTRILFRRCFGGTVQAIGQTPGYGLGFALRQIRHEVVALVHTSTIGRGC